VTELAVPLVLASIVMAPVWLILLLEVKLILPPFEFMVMAPVCVIPVLDPALVLLARTEMLPVVALAA